MFKNFKETAWNTIKQVKTEVYSTAKLCLNVSIKQAIFELSVLIFSIKQLLVWRLCWKCF